MGTKPVMPRAPQPHNPQALRPSLLPHFISLHLGGPSEAQGAEAWADAARGWEGMPRGLAPNGVFWHRQQGLLQVLKAYTLYRPEQGYCQAQGPVAAVLLMHLPPEVSALDPAPGT